MPTQRHEYTQEDLDEAVAAERERCAKRCDALAKACTGINARLAYRHAATEIRGQTQTLNQEKA